MGGWAPAFAVDGPPGITTPIVLPPFNPNSPTCSAPSGLTPSLGFVQENDREFLEGVNKGLAMAAKDRGLPYTQVLASSDAARASQEIQSYLAAKTGAVVATSLIRMRFTVTFRS